MRLKDHIAQAPASMCLMYNVCDCIIVVVCRLFIDSSTTHALALVSVSNTTPRLFDAKVMLAIVSEHKNISMWYNFLNSVLNHTKLLNCDNRLMRFESERKSENCNVTLMPFVAEKLDLESGIALTPN